MTRSRETALPASHRGTLPPEASAQLAAVLDGFVRVGSLVGIPRLLRELGADPHGVCASSGVDLRLLDDPESTMSFNAAGRLLAACTEATGRDHFGLLLGQREGLDGLGLVGMLGACSPNLEQALRSMVLHLHLHDRGAIPDLDVRNREVRVGYTIYQPGIEGTAQIYDLAMAISCNILRELCGPGWRPQEVRLSRVRPADVAPYRAFFGVRPRFESHHSAVIFSAKWLAQPLHGANPLLHQALLTRIEALTGADGHDVAAQVRRITCNLLLCQSATLGAVADVFSIHPRTLNRQLQAQGTSYRELRDQCRHALASQLLRETDLAVADIALRLGYSDTAALTRAFRRWSGQPPAIWRSSQRSR